MYASSSALIYLSLIAIVGFVIYFVYYVIVYAMKLADLNNAYYESYGLSNT